VLHTALCDLLALEHPIIQAGMGPFASAELAAAVSNAGGLGTVGASTRPSLEHLQYELDRIRDLTDRSFAVNHNAVVAGVDPELFERTLAVRPALISFALAPPGDLVERAHAAGSLVMAQVTSVEQAELVAAQGVDIIVAQGGECGGFGGDIAALPLIPQVVDAVRPIPVVAAGGIADGRGVAAALCLGAQGVNMGTRFLATREAPIHEAWQRAILAAQSDDPRKLPEWNDVMPSATGEFPTAPRALTSPFTDALRAGAGVDESRLTLEDAVARGRLGELMPFTGQSAGLVHDIVPAGELVEQLSSEAAAVLLRLAETATAGRFA
jgi:enoyl-[acyl-carrier protein] reductase II